MGNNHERKQKGLRTQDNSLTKEKSTETSHSGTSECTTQPIAPEEQDSCSNSTDQEISNEKKSRKTGLRTHPNSLSSNSLRHIIEIKQSPLIIKSAIAPVSTYRTFANRLRHGHGGTTKADMYISDILEKDPAIQNYYNSIRARRGNNCFLSHDTQLQIRGTTRSFAKYSNLPITSSTIAILSNGNYRTQTLATFEQVLQRFSVEPPLQYHASQASWILGIFKANFAPLQLRVNTHFPPADENCSEGTFIKIFNEQDGETQDMIQWGQYGACQLILPVRMFCILMNELR